MPNAIVGSVLFIGAEQKPLCDLTPTESISAQDVYQFMNKHNIVVSFVGDLTHEVTTTLLSNIIKSINSLEADATVKKKLYNVTVECIENITHHNLKERISLFGGKIPPTIFIFSGNEHHYKITTGNHINNSEIRSLADRIDKVNSLDKNGLKDIYRNRISEKGESGGLGIIDIAIKSGCKLGYDFKPVSENISFFTFQTTINK